MSETDQTADPAQARALLLQQVAQIALAMASLSRYRHMPLRDIHALILEPLMRGRVVVSSKPSSPQLTGHPAGAGPAVASRAAGTVLAGTGVAIWASVSEAVDARIREQIKARVFPIRLEPGDWTSGEIVWLFDVMAPTRAETTALLHHVVKLARPDGARDQAMKLHPLVQRLADLDGLKTDAPTAGPSDGERSDGGVRGPGDPGDTDEDGAPEPGLYPGSMPPRDRLN